MGFLKKIFGTHSDHELKRLYPIADKIEAMSDEYAALTDEQLRAKTDEFKQRYADGESLDDLLPEAFATAREAAWRVLGMKPFRVQLIGGIVLHQGRIAEMKTGEGKTLVAVLPAYLNALTGEGVHIVTVNDYLARRDSEWMGKVYRFLGLTRRPDRARHVERRAPAGLRAPTSPTARTTRWALTTCATTWPSTKPTDGAARPRLRHRRRGGLHPHR